MAKDARREPPRPDTIMQLIQLGRDREAAELAADVIVAKAGELVDPATQMDSIVPLLDDLVAALDDDALARPTPCAKFNLRQVLEHMVGGATAFSYAFRGETPQDAALPDDIVAAFPTAMAELQAAMRSPGALDRTIAAPYGDVSGDTFARFVALDGLVHGWDIATTSGQAYNPPADVVEEVAAFARGALDELRDGDTFATAAEAPANASPLEQLIAFTGRRST